MDKFPFKPKKLQDLLGDLPPGERQLFMDMFAEGKDLSARWNREQEVWGSPYYSRNSAMNELLRRRGKHKHGRTFLRHLMTRAKPLSRSAK